MENSKINNNDHLKEKKINSLIDQVKACQEKKIQAESQCYEMSQMINQLSDRFAFYRSALDNGLDAKRLFFEEIPFDVQVDYEIKIYHHIVNEIRRRSKIIAFIVQKYVNKMIQNLEQSKTEELNRLINRDKNLKVVK